MDPLIVGTAITDDELNELFSSNDEEVEVTVYGEVDLDYEERLILNRRPEFAIYDVVDRKRLIEEMNVAMTKVRWDRTSQGWNQEEEDDYRKLSNEDKKISDEKLEGELDEDSQMRLVYDNEQDRVDMGSRRSTDMCHNTRVILPPPRSPAEEAVLDARLGVDPVVQVHGQDNHTRTRINPKVQFRSTDIRYRDGSGPRDLNQVLMQRARTSAPAKSKTTATSGSKGTKPTAAARTPGRGDPPATKGPNR